MSIKDLTKEDLELMSYKDITNLLLEEKGGQNTADLFGKITKLLELPKSTFENKIGDYYTTLTTDKRFVLLEDGNWDLKNRHKSDKVIIKIDDEDEIEEDIDSKDLIEEEESEDFDRVDSNEDEFDDNDDDLKDLVVIDEDELGLEE